VVVARTAPRSNSALVYVPYVDRTSTFQVTASSTVPGGVISNHGHPVILPDQTATHRFDFGVTPLVLRLLVENLAGQPLLHRRCTFTPIGEPPITQSTDNRGHFEVPIAAHTGSALLEVFEAAGDPPATEPVLAITLSIGDLHLPQTTTGSRSRINNLGLDAGSELPGGFDDAHYHRALSRFQSVNDVFVTPEIRNEPNVSPVLDAPTSQALKRKHDV
jgi:hypothetical protein